MKSDENVIIMMNSNQENSVCAVPNPSTIVAEFNTLVQKNNCGQPDFSYVMVGPSNDAVWSCSLKYIDKITVAKAQMKRTARVAAILQWMNHFGPQSNVLGGQNDDTVIWLGNMDVSAVAEAGEEVETLDIKGNTILATAHGQTVSKTATIVDGHLGYISGGVHEFPYITNRFHMLEDVEWNTSQKAGQIIKIWKLPSDVLANNRSAPITALCRQFLMARFHMGVKFITNSTKFHAGTLVVGVRYGTASGDTTQLSSSRQIQQMNCAYIQACSANDAELDINFMSPFDFVPMGDVVAINGLFFCELYIGVVNQLMIGTGASPTVSVKGMVKFSSNNNHTGFAIMKSIPPANSLEWEGNMFDTLFNVADGVNGVIKKVSSLYEGTRHYFTGKTNDEDRPIVPVDRTSVFLQPMPDMSLGNGIVDLVSMRLSKDARTPHSASKLPIVDSQFSIDYLRSIFGGFINFSWDSSKPEFSELLTIQVSPIQYVADFQNRALFPPVSELSAHFSMFSGGLKFRFIFGASMMHSGRLACVFIPNDKYKVTSDNWSDYPYVVFDLQEQQQFEYVPPQAQLNAMKPLTWVKEESPLINFIYSYGVIKVIVLNPLKYIDSVSKVINCEVQIAGDDDYKLYVPKTSIIRSVASREIDNWCGNMESRTAVVTELNSTSLGRAENVTIGENFTLAAACRRFNNVGGVTETLDRGVYILRFNVNAGWPIPRLDGTVIDIVSAMHDGFRFFKGGINYVIEVNSRNPVNASVIHQAMDEELFADFHLINYDNDKDYAILNYANQTLQPSYNPSLMINVPWYLPTNMMINGHTSYTSSGNFVPYYTNNGALHIMLNVLEDATNVSIGISRALADDAEMFCFQSFPLRWMDSTAPYRYLNIFGSKADRIPPEIPSISTDFCYFVNDIVKTGIPESPLNMVFHNYDPGLLSWNVNTFFSNGNPLIYTMQDKNMAVVAFNSNRPQVAYNPNYIYFDPQKEQLALKLTIKFKTPGSETIQTKTLKSGESFLLTLGYRYQMYIEPNSISDEGVDWQPNMCSIKEVCEILRKDKDFRCKKSWVDDAWVVNKVKCHLAGFKKMMRMMIFMEGEQLEGNMEHVRFIASSMRSTLSNVVNLPSNVNSAASNISSVAENLSNMVDSVSSLGNPNDVNNIGWFSSIIEIITSSLKNAVGSILTEVKSIMANCIIHVFNLYSTTDTRIRIASFLGLLVTVRVISVDMIMEGFSILKQIGLGLFRKVVGNADEEEGRVKEVMAWFSLIVPFLTCSLGFSKNYAKMGMGAFHNFIKETVRTSNDIGLFVQRNFQFVTKYIYYLVGKENPVLQNIAVIRDRKEEMEKWAKEVLLITQGHTRDRVFASSGLQKHVDLLFRQGNQYLEVIRNENLNGSAFNAIYRKISQLHFDLGQRVGRGNLTKEPVTVWLYGASGVGKSNVAKAMAGSWLVSHSVTYDGDFAFVRNATRYWNGWADQPCVIYDDAFQNLSQEALTQEVTEMFSICSVAEYNPEMPALEDKNRLVNPDIVMYCSNVSHPNINIVQSREAMWRRRDVLLEVALTPHYIGMGVTSANDSRITAEDLVSYAHLRFRCLSNISATYVPPNEWHTYEEIKSIIFPRMNELRARRMAGARSRQVDGLLLSTEAYANRLAREDTNSIINTASEIAGLPTLTEVLERRDNGGEDTDDDDLESATDSEEELIGDCDVCWFGDIPQTVFATPIRNIDGIACYCELFHRFADYCPVRNKMCINFFRLRNFDDAAFNQLKEAAGIQLKRLMENRNCFLEAPFPPTMEYLECGLAEYCSENCLTQDLRQRAINLADRLREQGEPLDLVQSVTRMYWESGISTGFSSRYAQMQDTQNETLLNLFIEENNVNTGNMVSSDDSASNISSVSSSSVSSFSSVSRPSHFEPIRPVQTSIWQYMKKAAIVVCLVSCVLVTLYAIWRSFTNDYSLFFSGKNPKAWFWEKLKLHIVVMLSLAGFIKAYSSLVGNVLSSGDVTTVRMGSQQVIINHEHVRGNMDDVGPSKPIQEVGSNANKNDLNLRVAKNTATIIIFNFKDDKREILAQGNVFMIGGRKGICPFHYTTIMSKALQENKSAQVILRIRTDLEREVEIQLNIENLIFTRIHKLDLAWVEFPPRVPSFKKIIGQVATAADHRQFKLKARIVNGYDLALKAPQLISVECKRMHIRTNYSGVEDIYLLGYQYSWAGRGKCAAVLIDDKRDIIVGLHVAGSVDDSKGSAVILDKSILEKILGGEDLEPPEVSDEVIKAEPVLQANGCVDVVGKTPAHLEMRPIVKTQIRKSIAHNVISPPSRFPVCMRTKGERVPGYDKLAIGVNKQLVSNKPFPKKVIDQSVVFLKDKILCLAKPITPDVSSCRSVGEAISGVPGVSFMEGIKLQTSVGWPLCVSSAKSKKKNFVDEVDGIVAMKPELQRIYDANHNKRLEGKVPFTVYADFCKDERLKPGKDVRLINGAPFDHTIEWRRYTMDCFAAIQTAQLEIGSAIGINPYGYGFEYIARRLLEKGSFVITGDYTAFGYTIPPEFVFGIGEIVRSWNKKFSHDYVEQHSLVVRILFEEVMNCYHVAGDCVYRTFNGCPSGNPYTAIINTLSNLLYLYCSWLLIFRETSLCSLVAMHKWVYIVCYGDDFIGATNNVISKVWNTQTISSVFANYGIKFTDASKSDVIVPYTTIYEAEFLKNTFRLHETRNIFVACLKKSVIEDIFNWIREPCPDEIAQLVDLSYQIARFSSLHGNHYFVDVVGKMWGWFCSQGIFCPIPTWQYFDSLFDSDNELEWVDAELFSLSSFNYSEDLEII